MVACRGTSFLKGVKKLEKFLDRLKRGGERGNVMCGSSKMFREVSVREEKGVARTRWKAGSSYHVDGKP